jgi:tetratricopeptide (TPR) repeat protein
MLESVHQRLEVPMNSLSHIRGLSRQSLCGFFAAMLVLAGAAPAAADLWYQHYQKAQEALERQEWESAVEELNQAIARRGDSGARVRTYGMRTTDYFPYLGLGIAYLNLGQPEAAVQAFETEERLGAISASERGQQRLEQFREEAEAQIAAHRDQEQQRIEQILSESVTEAETLAARGNLDEAMVALGRGLAVSPEDPGATELMEKLRDSARKLEAERRVASQVEGLVTQGKGFVDQGAFEKAAGRFRQALALRPGDMGVQRLLDETQSLLKQAMREEAATGEPALDVDAALNEALRLEQAGRLDEALSILQSVLALEPRDVQARTQEERVLAARERALEEEGNRAAAEEEIAAAAANFSAGRFEASLSAANRALTFSPANPAALDLVTRSYREISRVLLGRSMGGNIPPAIRFADFRHDHSGQYLQAVSDPEFRLAGMVIDNSPVALEVTDGREQVLPVAVDSQQLGDFYLTEFQVDLELEVGQQTIRVVATDAEALSASSEYAVLYQRPRLRSPWFLTLLAAVLIGLLGAVAMRRSRRRARRRQRRFNPYVAGAPVLDEELFFGRSQLIDRILQTIHNNSLLLYGERRIGKTSIQHHLKKRLLELQDPIYDFYPVYVDLQGTPEDRFFATIAEDVFQQLAEEVDLPAERSFEDDQAEYSYRDLVRDLRSVIRQLDAGSSKKVKLVLLIDEVDELNDYDPRINQRLRSLFMKSFAESLVAVVSGVEIKKHWERVGSPWYNFFEEIEVLPLDDEEARRLIERPIAGVLRIQDGVVERILEVTGKRPYLIQKMCVALVNQAYERGSTVIAIEDIDAVTPVEVP